jgi:transcriptional regulator with XRE-family HTH domain
MVVSPAELQLARRLRELRRQSPRGRLTQAQVARAFGVSAQQISSWESAKSPQLPSEERLKNYALLFSSAGLANGEPTVVEESSLTAEQRQAKEALEAELRVLRDTAVASGRERLAAQPLDGFWAFPDGRPVVIIGSEQPPEVLAHVPEADKHHPDYVEFMRHADADAVVEIFGQVRADNPASLVQTLLPPTVRNNEHLPNHVVVVGGGWVNSYAGWFTSEGDVPASSVPSRQPTGVHQHAVLDLDPGGWKDRRFIVPARLAADVQWPKDLSQDEEGKPVAALKAKFSPSVPAATGMPPPSTSGAVREEVGLLYEDIALIARQPNPLDPSATTTLVYGLFSRGSYGAARAFTDPEVRESNEAYLRERFDGSKRFWMLFRVLCDRRLPVTKSPDFRQPGTVLIEWSG